MPDPNALRAVHLDAADPSLPPAGASAARRLPPSRRTPLQVMTEEAAVSKAEAREAALGVASGRVSSIELCRAVDGRLLYVVLIAGAARAPKRAVLVDAQTGAVVRELG